MYEEAYRGNEGIPQFSRVGFDVRGLEKRAEEVG